MKFFDFFKFKRKSKQPIESKVAVEHPEEKLQSNDQSIDNIEPEEINDQIDRISYNDPILVKESVVTNQQNSSSDTRLADALSGRFPSIERAKLLLENGADPNVCDKYGIKLLVDAATYQKAKCVELLLQFGADPNSVDKYGDSALGYAVIHNNSKIAETLLEAGASTQSLYKRKPVLFHAADEGNQNMIKVLIKYGVEGESALGIAAEENNLHVIKNLQDKGFTSNLKMEVKEIDITGWSFQIRSECMKRAIEEKVISDEYAAPKGLIVINWPQITVELIFVFGKIRCKSCQNEFNFKFIFKVGFSSNKEQVCTHCNRKEIFSSKGVYKDKNYKESLGTFILGPSEITSIERVYHLEKR